MFIARVITSVLSQNWICELKNMEELILSYNYLGLESLEYLSLFDNNFEGHFSIGLLANLSKNQQTSLARVSLLSVDNNQFTGKIGRGLRSLEYLYMLDISNINLTGVIPRWIGTLPSLYALLLSNNSLEGVIPVSLFTTENLKVLDLSANNLSGSMPPYLSSAYGPTLLLQDSTLSEVIPETLLTHLGDLVQLLALNLSHNNLSGVIPESFSRLGNMESLDLSFNQIQGRIPPQLTDVSSLAVFNFSYNNLSGVIPQGRQFNTFDTSYLGNPLFCGKPTNLSCDNNNNNNYTFQEPDNGVESYEITIDMISFYWSFAAAYVTILSPHSLLILLGAELGST
ncbi:hypothetical protein CARUB_v10022404mg [Capsella rubella]|uniref:Leucine-rich repeat-containing N-terminal plant-type domain-containing protein n=1 Tax=Capsella rubella TaxID=81985 RepID=R0GGI9_9BRAS|nr:hypothetical protein CARUB_v10022404mg [Capsella rubella]